MLLQKLTNKIALKITLQLDFYIKLWNFADEIPFKLNANKTV